MAYTINLTDGTVFATIPDGTTNNATSALVLVGKNYAGYGEFLDENFVHVLENSANTTAPTSPLTGQLWWDKTNFLLKVYNGTIWKTISAATASSSQPTSNVTGDLWYDTTNQQLKVYTGSSFIVVGPAYTSSEGTAGAIPGSVNDSGGSPHFITSLYVNNTQIAIVSVDAAFTPAAPTNTNFPTIFPGITVTKSAASTLAGNVVNTGNLTLTAAGATTVTVTSTGANITGYMNSTGNITGGNVLGGANVNATLHSGTTVSVTGVITGASVVGGVITGTSSSVSGIVTGASVVGGVITGTSSSVSGIVTGASVVGGVITGTSVSLSGNVQAGNVRTGGLLSASGNITSAGNVDAGFYLGNGSLLTGLSSAVSVTKIVNGTTEANAVSSGGNIAFTVGGTSNVMVVATTGIAVTGFSTPAIVKTGTNAVGNIGAVGSYFNAVFADNYNGASVVGGVITGTSVSVSGSVSAPSHLGTSVSVTGNVTGANFIGNVIGNVIPPAGGAVSTTGNITGGNILSSGSISATGTITGASVVGGVITGSSVSVTGIATAASTVGGVITGSSASVTGIVTGASVVGGVITGSSASVTGIVTGASVVGGVITGSSASVTGIVTGASVVGGVITATSVSVTGNVTGNYILGNGSQLTGVTATGVAASALTGTTMSSNVTISSLTSVGTLTSLAVTGNITSGNVQGTLHSGTTVSVTGVITGASVVGGVITGSSASVTGIVTGASVVGGVITGSSSSVTGIVTGASVVGGVITGSSSSVTGIVTGASVVGGVITGSSSSVTGIVTGASVVGGVITGSSISVSGTVTGAGNVTINTQTPVAYDTTGSITSGRLLGRYANRSGNASFYFFDYNSSNTITSADSLAASKLGSLLDSTIGNSNISMSLGTNYGNKPAGLAFISGTASDILGVSVNTPPTYAGNINAVLLGYPTVGPRILVQDYALSDNSPNVITYIATTHSFIGNITGSNVSVTGTVTSDGAGSFPSITHTGTNAVGNIGSSSSYFNQVFATATTALYADVAERFEADEQLESGTVVELGGSKEITKSMNELSENVFGVISTRPAYTMNGGAGENDTHPPVAMTGRVPVKVTGRINKGDRLVSAGSGLARAAQPGEATSFNVIGRSLVNKPTIGLGVVEAIVTIT